MCSRKFSMLVIVNHLHIRLKTCIIVAHYSTYSGFWWPCISISTSTGPSYWLNPTIVVIVRVRNVGSFFIEEICGYMGGIVWLCNSVWREKLIAFYIITITNQCQIGRVVWWYIVLYYTLSWVNPNYINVGGRPVCFQDIHRRCWNVSIRRMNDQIVNIFGSCLLGRSWWVQNVFDFNVFWMSSGLKEICLFVDNI